MSLVCIKIRIFKSLAGFKTKKFGKMSLVMRKLDLCIYAKTKAQISCAVTAQLISAFVFATQILQSLYFLNPKFQASSHLVWLHSLVCVGPGRKPRRPVFSRRGSYKHALYSIYAANKQLQIRLRRCDGYVRICISYM